MNRSHAASQVATAWGYFLPHSESRKMSCSASATLASGAV
jgi:hypothetical protein